MARYTADPTQDVAGFPILPGGDYRLKIGEPKAFKGETKSGENKGDVNYGVRFMCTVIPGPVDKDGKESPKEQVAKKAVNNLYYHTQESRNFSKGFILAAFGYKPNEDEEFNKKIQELRAENPEDPMLDWSFDPDTGEVGTAWRALANKEIVATLGIQKAPDNSDRQQWVQVRPIPQV